MRRVYLDYAATTPLDILVRRAMDLVDHKIFGNPSSLHHFGQEAQTTLDTARATVARVLEVDFREIVFTGSATEANNLAVRGAVRMFRTSYPQHLPRLIISTIEHESVLATADELARDGVEVVRLKVTREGFVDLSELEKSLNNERTALVSVLHANNEIGTIQPIGKIAELVRTSRKAGSPYPLLHTDAAQAFQYLPCLPKTLGVELLTLSAHKIYGPKGVGALCVRSGTPLTPIITGGGQEFGLRSGTENLTAIVGLARAAELSLERRIRESKRVEHLRDYFLKKVRVILPDVSINGSLRDRLPNNLNLRFPGKRAADILVSLDRLGIAASAGSACASRSPKPSPTLQAIGLNDKAVRESIRFSLGKPTTKAHIDIALKAILQLKNA